MPKTIRDPLRALTALLCLVAMGCGDGPTAAAVRVSAFDTPVQSPMYPVIGPAGNLSLGTKDVRSFLRIGGDLLGTPTSTGFETNIIPDTPLVGPAGNIWFGNANPSGTVILRASGDLSGTPEIRRFEAGIPSLQFAAAGPHGDFWFGGTSNTTYAVRVSGDLSGVPTIALVDTGILNPAAPARGPHGTLWFGNLTPGVVNDAVVRLVRD